MATDAYHVVAVERLLGSHSTAGAVFDVDIAVLSIVELGACLVPVPGLALEAPATGIHRVLVVPMDLEAGPTLHVRKEVLHAGELVCVVAEHALQ